MDREAGEILIGECDRQTERGDGLRAEDERAVNEIGADERVPKTGPGGVLVFGFCCCTSRSSARAARLSGVFARRGQR